VDPFTRRVEILSGTGSDTSSAVRSGTQLRRLSACT
jgi:hypothetical protein